MTEPMRATTNHLTGTSNVWLWFLVSGLTHKLCKGKIYFVSLFSSETLYRVSVQKRFAEQINFHFREKE